MILHDAPKNMTLWQVARDALPFATTILTLQDIWGEVATLVIVYNHVNGIRVVQIGFDVIDEEAFGYARQRVDFPPVGATVFTNLDQAIIGSRVDETLDHGRFG